MSTRQERREVEEALTWRKAVAIRVLAARDELAAALEASPVPSIERVRIRAALRATEHARAALDSSIGVASRALDDGEP
jgi:hypothetical protein